MCRTRIGQQLILCKQSDGFDSRRARLRAVFSKRNARPFFVSGLLLLVMSLFVIYPVYYLVVGSALMIAAIVVRAVGDAG